MNDRLGNNVVPIDKNSFGEKKKAERLKVHRVDTEQEIAEKNYNRFKRAFDHGHKEYVDHAKRCDDFYKGDQWSKEDKQKLEKQRRPALTINTILSTVNTIVGEQTTGRMDVLFKPRKNGAADTAAALTKLWLHVSDDTDYEAKETQVFTDGLIQDRGYFDIRINFEDNIEGEIEITAEDPLFILPDPDAKDYDISTWKEVTKYQFMRMDELRAIYGDKKADAVETAAFSGQHYGRDSIQMVDNTFGDFDESGGVLEGLQAEDAKQIRTVRVIERQYVMWEMVRYFVDPTTGDKKRVPPSWDEKRIEAQQQRFNLRTLERRERRIRWTTSCDKVLLHDDWSPYRTFTIVPYFPYFRRGKPFGMVGNLLSPQEMLNKISSQELHVVNSTANSGWKVESGSLVNMEVDDLEARGCETGLVIEYAPGRQPPEKIQPNSIPTGLDRIGIKAAQNIKDISGVSDSMLGNASAEVSGVALESKKEQGKIQIQMPMQNLARSRKMVARKVLELLQAFYNEPRMFFITDFRVGQEQEEVGVNQPGIDEQGQQIVLNDLTLGDYEVNITHMPARDNFEDAQFATMMSLRNAGVGVPDDSVVEYSPLYKKDELAERIRQLQGTAAPTEEEIAQMERDRQIADASAEAEIKKLQATVLNLEASAMLAKAKAEDIANSDNMELQQLETELQQKREELDLRMRIARVSAANKNNIASIGAQGKLMAQRMTAAQKQADAQKQPNSQTEGTN